MIYKIWPSQDATIYSEFPSENSGLDPILEASTYIDAAGNYQVSRFLIQFDSNDIKNILSLIGASSYASNLRVFKSNVFRLTSPNTILEIRPISQSWNMGTGHHGDQPEVNNGVSWVYTDISGSTKWVIPGGTYYTGSILPDPIITQSFSYYSNKDINVDITNIVSLWLGRSATLNNYGVIIKQSSIDVEASRPQTNFSFYSRDTHTIYPPCLEFKWDDSVHSSSLSIINSPDLIISSPNNKGEFYSGNIQQFRFYASPKYPNRIYQTSSLYTTNYILPISSSYAIKDLDTNELVINFDPLYTKISADATSSYFNINMGGLEPERSYKILIQIPFSNSNNIFDENIIFKVKGDC